MNDLPTETRCGWCGALMGESVPVWSARVTSHGICPPCAVRVEAEMLAASGALS